MGDIAVAEKRFKCLTLLIVSYCAVLCISTLMVERLTVIGGLSMSSSSLLIPITYLISDIVTEVYGYENTRKLIWFGIFAVFVFSIIGVLMDKLPIPGFWHEQAPYQTVLTPLLRNTLAYTVSSIGGLFLNAYVLSKWKILTHGRFFLFRSVGSSIIGEAIFVVIGFSILFIGVLPFKRLLMLMLASLLIKVIVNVVSVWPGALVAAVLKKVEHYDPYDTNISFNPFKLAKPVQSNT